MSTKLSTFAFGGARGIIMCMDLCRQAGDACNSFAFDQNVPTTIISLDQRRIPGPRTCVLYNLDSIVDASDVSVATVNGAPGATLWSRSCVEVAQPSFGYAQCSQGVPNSSFLPTRLRRDPALRPKPCRMQSGLRSPRRLPEFRIRERAWVRSFPDARIAQLPRTLSEHAHHRLDSLVRVPDVALVFLPPRPLRARMPGRGITAARTSRPEREPTMPRPRHRFPFVPICLPLPARRRHLSVLLQLCRAPTDPFCASYAYDIRGAPDPTCALFGAFATTANFQPKDNGPYAFTDLSCP